MQIGSFVKDLFAGFQLLNLKNDVLRKRSDGMKYSVSRSLIFLLGDAMGLLMVFWECRLRRSRMLFMTCRCGT